MLKSSSSWVPCVTTVGRPGGRDTAQGGGGDGRDSSGVGPDSGVGSDPAGVSACPFSGTTVGDDDGAATVGYGNKCGDGSGSVGGGGSMFGSGDM